MANRHLARSVVLQVLFERDASEGRMTAEEALDRLSDYSKEFGARDHDKPFMEDLLKTAIAKQKEIDEVIVKAAPEWPLDKIAAIDRNILRLGLTELLYADRAQVPAKVAINEAIELAKTFGSASSGRFVNGVLGAVYVELGEPGKAEGGKRKEPNQKQMPVEHLAGAARHQPVLQPRQAEGARMFAILTIGALKEILYQVVTRGLEYPEERIVDAIYELLRAGYLRVER